MPGKVRKCLRDKTIRNVLLSSLSETDKNCILDVFIRYEQMLDKETEEVKHGSWKKHPLANGVVCCSECGYARDCRAGNSCPECGAKMDGKQ